MQGCRSLAEFFSKFSPRNPQYYLYCTTLSCCVLEESELFSSLLLMQEDQPFSQTCGCRKHWPCQNLKKRHDNLSHIKGGFVLSLSIWEVNAQCWDEPRLHPHLSASDLVHFASWEPNFCPPEAVRLVWLQNCRFAALQSPASFRRRWKAWNADLERVIRILYAFFTKRSSNYGMQTIG